MKNKIYFLVFLFFVIGLSVKGDTITNCNSLKILTQPADENACTGNTASFTVDINSDTADTPVIYQWWIKGTPGTPQSIDRYIDEATNKDYTFNNVDIGNAGTYYCVISNPCGSVTSNMAVLTTQYSPNGTTPANVYPVLGGSATFATYSNGTGFSYQWYVKNPGWVPANGVPYTTTSTTNSSQLNINPVSVPGTYECVISNACGQFTAGPVSLILECCGFSWTGNTSTEWETGSNWSNGFSAPGISDDAFIPPVTNLPVVNAGISAACHNLTIYSNATLTINGSLNVNGNLNIQPMASVTVNGSSNGSLTVKGTLSISANSVGSGALNQTDGSVVNFTKGKVSRYIALLSAYHYMGSPFTNSNINMFIGFTPTNMNCKYLDPNNPPSAFPNIFVYDERHTHNLNFDDNGWKSPCPGEIMLPMHGYAPYFTANQTINLIGNIFNTGDQTMIAHVYSKSTDTLHNNLCLDQYGYLNKPGCVNVGTGPTNGLFILGNPYPSPIDLIHVLNNGNEIGGNIISTFFFWHPINTANQGYYCYLSNYAQLHNPPLYLSVMGAALMLDYASEDDSSVLTFSNADRSVDPAALKFNSINKSDKNKNLELIRLSVNMLGNEEMYDETAIFFNPNASFGLNKKLDVYKLRNTAKFTPNIYTLSPQSIDQSHQKFAIKALPELNDNLIIPLGLSVNTDGKYTINASEINNIPAGVHVYLVDIKNKFTQDMTEKSSYTFDIAGCDDSRFYLKFTNAYHNTAPELCYIYSSDKDLFVSYSNPDNEPAYLSFYNITGELIKSKVSISNGTYHTNLDIAQGIYFVKVVSESNVYVRKVYIK
jgi:hypothetical protein